MTPPAGSLSPGPDTHARAKRLLAAFLLGVLACLIAQRCAYQSLARQGWLNSWEYLTRKDRGMGFRLREGISSNYSGVVVAVDEDGARSAEARGRAPTRGSGELLVLSAGDSNTFGVGIPFEATYSSLLEGLLRKRLARPVHVVNLGVPGHSLLQTKILLDRWAYRGPDVIIVADSFNNRAFLGESDSVAAFSRDFYLTRPYEFGSSISYPILWAYRRFFLLPRQGKAPVPSLAEPLPTPRVPLPRYQGLIHDLVGLASRRGALLVFVVAGEGGLPGVTPLEEGIDAFHEGRWQGALSIFESIRRLRPRWYLPAFYSFRCATQLQRPYEAAAIEREFAAAYGGESFRYLDSFTNLPSDYLPTLADAGGNSALVDVREPLRGRFVDICHYDSSGHALIAERLAGVIEQRLPGKIPVR